LQEPQKGRLLLAVATDGLDWAAAESFFAKRALFVRFRLLVEEGVAAVVVALKVGWRGLTAKVAVDALIVHIVGTVYVLGVFVGCVCHGLG
jgi:hypothetical protein